MGDFRKLLEQALRRRRSTEGPIESKRQISDADSQAETRAACVEHSQMGAVGADSIEESWLADAYLEEAAAASASSAHLMVGIDIGTSTTKVCIREVLG